MAFDWKSLPALRTASFTNAAGQAIDFPFHLGAHDEELADAMRGVPVVAPLTDRAWLRCSGPDACSFLHNQLTSDINHLTENIWQNSSWCTAKGRMLASFMVVSSSASTPDSAPDYLLQLSTELRPEVAKRFAMYVLRAKVRIDLADELVDIGLAGNTGETSRILTEAGLPCPDSPNQCTRFPGGWAMRINNTMLQLAVSTDRAAELFATLGAKARPVGLDAWHWLEIQAGQPMITRATKEEFVPQMVNFDKNGGVSFHKGCYPGQEVVARTQYLGKVKRHLYRIHATTPLLAGMALQTSDAEGTHSAGIVAYASSCPDGGFDALAVILEGAASQPIVPDFPGAPPLSTIVPVTV